MRLRIGLGMTESALNRELVPIKLALEEARSRLSDREWATLMAILALFVESEFPRKEREAQW